MHLAGEAIPTQPFVTASVPVSSPVQQPSILAQYKVIRRNGAVVAFEPWKISVAMTKAFLAVSGGQGAASARIRELVAQLTDGVVRALIRRQPAGGTFHIEDIQDQVELALMRSGEHDTARAYVLYRERRAQVRAQEAAERRATSAQPVLHAVEHGARRPLDTSRLGELVESACAGLGERSAAAAHPPGHAEKPLRRHPDGRGSQVGDPVGARSDREGPRLLLRDRTPSAEHHPARSARRGGVAS